MIAIPRTFLAAFTLVFLQVAVSSGQDVSAPNVPDPSKPAKPMRAQLQEKQIDVSLEARDIERILSKLKKASELSKQRITEAAVKAEAASVSLEKGDSKAAGEEARQTAEMFKEIAKQLEALLKEETPQRIAEARQLAQQLAKAERDFAEQFDEALKPMEGNGKAKGEGRSKETPKNGSDGNRDENKPQDGNKEKGGNEKEGDETGDMPQSKGNIGKNPGDGLGGQDPTTDKNKPKESQAKSTGTGTSRDDANDRDDRSGDKPQPAGAVDATPGDKPKDGGFGNKKNSPGDTPDVPTNGSSVGSEKKGPTNRASKESGDKTKGGGSGDSKNEPNEDAEKEGSGRGYRDASKTGGSGGAVVERLNGKRRNGSGQALTAAELREVVAERAAMLAESGKTLEDVLREIAKSTDPSDKDAVAKIEAVLKEINVEKLVGEMSQISLMVRSKKDGDAKLSSLDVAERLEIMAQRLETAYRTIVAPQAEELRKLEQALLELRERLENLETPSQVAGWHRDLRELLNELDKLGVTLQAREEFENEMKKMGFSIDFDRTKTITDWSLVDGHYIVPDNFKVPLINLQEDIQQRIQGLILGDLGNISDDATPPKYQELVERYYQVLSRRNGTAGPAKKPASRGRK
jgi:hypothetical protein